MAKTRVFISYDYQHDVDMKNNLIRESRRSDSPFSINDVSLNEKTSDWQQKARQAIESCDVFLVLLRENTHQARGVLREIKMAKQLNKKRFQLREKGHNPQAISDAGEVVAWRWENLRKWLS